MSSSLILSTTVEPAYLLATWKPFKANIYAGEQRNSLNTTIEKVFQPLADKIQRYRIEQKGADRFPCLSLLCIVENKASGAVCDFRKHYTAQGGNQLIIPGFSSSNNRNIGYFPRNILGKSRKVPTIRGFAK